jgi:hypothetical protein
MKEFNFVVSSVHDFEAVSLDLAANSHIERQMLPDV